MEIAGGEKVWLEPWGEGDLWLLRRANAPEMTEHLGGPESEEQVAARHRRYLEAGPGQMYRVVSVESGEAVGSTGFWEREWRDGVVWEAGWGILPEFQGRGLAVAAARGVVAAARDAGGHRYLHAFPSEDNVPSNSVCRRAGLTLLGPVDLEYPKGHWMISNDWRADLSAP